MMLKNYLLSKKISLYRLSKDSHVPYSTVNDLANYKLPVENLKSGQLKALAETLSIGMDALYDLCRSTSSITSARYGVTADITVEHKTYYLDFETMGRHHRQEILPVRREATEYLDVLAEWALDEALERLEMEDAFETISSQTI